MFNDLMALLDTRICTLNSGHESRDNLVVAKVSTQHPDVTAELAPLWSAIGAWTPELERRAEGWFEMTGATALDDVVEYGLTQPFLDHLELKQVPRLKASQYLQARMKPWQARVSDRSLSASRSEQVAHFDLRDVEATMVSHEAKDKMHLLWLARPGLPPTACRGSSIIRRGRPKRRSATTGSRVSFSIDTKGGRGCPGDASPPSRGRTNMTRDRHHRQHSTSEPPFEAFGRSSLNSTRHSLPGPKGNPRICGHVPSGPHAHPQAPPRSVPKQVPNAWDSSIAGALWLGWLPQTLPLVRL